MKIKATLTELRTYDMMGMALWKTPGGGSYWATRPIWRDDYILATPTDFMEAQGWDTWDWEDMDDDDPTWEDVIEIDVRARA